MAGITIGPTQRDLSVYAGDRNVLGVELVTDTGAAWDVSGATVTAQARVTAPDPIAALTATCAVTDGPGGKVTIAWDGEDVRALLAGEETWTGVWDCQLLEAGQSLPVTLLRGKFVAVHDVTRGTP